MIITVLAFFIVAGGCCGGGKSSTQVMLPPAAEPTVGSQLKDLKEALDKGAISQREFDEQKALILRKAGESKQ